MILAVAVATKAIIKITDWLISSDNNNNSRMCLTSGDVLCQIFYEVWFMTRNVLHTVWQKNWVRISQLGHVSVKNQANILKKLQIPQVNQQAMLHTMLSCVNVLTVSNVNLPSLTLAHFLSLSVTSSIFFYQNLSSVSVSNIHAVQ